MRITGPEDVDYDVRAGATAGDVAQALGLAQVWCGHTMLDDDHPAGAAPLMHGALVADRPTLDCAPPAGRHLIVEYGPDAGAVVRCGEKETRVGRDTDCDLSLSDPALSRQHLAVRSGRHVVAIASGSTNGLGAGVRARMRWRPGKTLEVGRTRLRLMGAVDPRERERSRARERIPWAAAGASLMGGALFAVMTGRWYLMLVGLAYPLFASLSVLWHRYQDAHPGPPAPSPPGGRLAVVGDRDLAHAYVRAVMVLRGRRTGQPQWDEPWTRWLDDPVAHDEVAWVATGDTAPSWCDTTVRVTADAVTVTRDGETTRDLPLAYSRDTAEAAARRRASTHVADPLPLRVHWGDLPSTPPRGWSVALGVSAAGPLTVDLEADGPHMLVAGTTGSGKSVLLETLVSALAHAHSPDALSLALIDFKGGAGLRACMDLPHVRGVLTDLDGDQARRALTALARELDDRKAQLAEHRLTAWADWERRGDAPPRLVVVIDEYQEIVSQHRTFVPDIARLAAQGRSLGLHLILATQRPAGSVTPEIRANVGITIALRVASEGESRDLLGTSAAAVLPRDAPGRAVCAGGSHTTEFQTAAPTLDPHPAVIRTGEAPVTQRTVVHAARERWSTHRAGPPLWQPPLPTRWPPPAPSEGATHAVAVALVDQVQERTQEPAWWAPSQGPLCIAGPAGTGRTSALCAVAAQAASRGFTPVWLPPQPRLAARTIALAAQLPRALLLVDDADAALSRLQGVDDGAAWDALMSRAPLGLATAFATGPQAPARLAAAAGLVAVARGTDPAAAATWGAPRSLVDGTPAPGRFVIRAGSQWQEAQLVYGESAPHTALVAPLPTPGSPHAHRGWGTGGDDAREISAPEDAAILGPPSALRDHLAAQLRAPAAELAALMPPGHRTWVLTEPTARQLRQLAPHDWQGVASSPPLPGRVALVRDGRATAVQLSDHQGDRASAPSGP